MHVGLYLKANGSTMVVVYIGTLSVILVSSDFTVYMFFFFKYILILSLVSGDRYITVFFFLILFHKSSTQGEEGAED